jgi:hypothetical protein
VTFARPREDNVATAGGNGAGERAMAAAVDVTFAPPRRVNVTSTPDPDCSARSM